MNSDSKGINSDSRRIIYLNDISLKEACERWLDTLNDRGLLKPVGTETIAVDDSLGRVTGEPQFAAGSSPKEHCSAMDGYAVRFADTFGASQAQPKMLSLKSQAAPVDTGEPLPEGFNVVIMVEDVEQLSAGEIEITAPATPWQHVRTVGEDIVATELILPENHLIRPVDMAALLAGGLVEIKVRKRPRIAIIPTGSELVEPGAPQKSGSIVEFNSRLLAGMATGWGAQTDRHGIVPDDFAAIKSALKATLNSSDMVLINAGSSAGREDFTVHVIRELGEVLIHGVRIKPGKPVVLGIVDNKPVIGIPGYPVSAVLAMELFAAPVIERLQGIAFPERPKARVKILRKIPSSIGSEEFIRMKLGSVGGRLVATPIERGSGALMSLVRADGMLKVPENSEGIKAGDTVDITLLRGLDEVENTVVAVGSHDIALDLLAGELKKVYPRLSLSSAHVGSMGGLMALKRREAHLAGTHLLDEETGEYNISYLKRYLPEMEVSLINLAKRQQGLIVARENPKNIAGVADLARNGLAFINRQRGAGTRVLFDFLLKQQGIAAAEITGYHREEYTHMAVAAAVLSGSADAGMGILAAANALALGFIPIAMERYDLAIPKEHLDLPGIKALLGVMTSDAFKQKLLALGGYDIALTGQMMA